MSTPFSTTLLLLVAERAAGFTSGRNFWNAITFMERTR